MDVVVAQQENAVGGTPLPKKYTRQRRTNTIAVYRAQAEEEWFDGGSCTGGKPE